MSIDVAWESSVYINLVVLFATLTICCLFLQMCLNVQSTMEGVSICVLSWLVAISVPAMLAMNLRAFQKAHYQPRRMLDEIAWVVWLIELMA